MVLALASAAPASAQYANTAEARAAQLNAMSRDFGITTARAGERLDAEAAARERHARLRPSMGASYGGAWFDASDNTLVIASTDARGAKLAKAGGAKVVLVSRSLEQLNGIQKKLDDAAKLMSDDQRSRVWMWAVDARNNTVVIFVPANDPQAQVAVQDFLTTAGVSAKSVRIEESKAGPPSLLYNTRGGDGIWNATDGRECSIGFAVSGGFITAGHCSGGTIGDSVTSMGVAMGNFAGAAYPGEDTGWVITNSSWTSVPCVGTGSTLCTTSGNVLVNGSTEAFDGSSVCRYGHLPQSPHCGVILYHNFTGNFYWGPTVNHLVMTNICAAEGDSGGPYMSGNQGQGTLSVGPPNVMCPIPQDSPVSWSAYYPLNLSLSTFGLTLTVAPGAAPPTPANFHVTYTYANAKYRFTASWSASPTAQQYVLSGHVYNGPNTSISWTVPENWEDLGLEYAVSACNANGCSMQSPSSVATQQ